MPWSKLGSKCAAVILILCSIIAFVQCQRFNRRQDVINDWIRTIRQSPKAHSISPSWNGKSPYNVIGVSNLPLQNEAGSDHEQPDFTAKSRQGEEESGLSDENNNGYAFKSRQRVYSNPDDDKNGTS